MGLNLEVLRPPQVARREPLNAKTSPRDSSKGQKTPSPHTMFHTPLGTARRVALYYFVVLKRRKCIRGLFLGVFGIRGGPLKGSPRLHKGIRRPRVRCAHVVGHVKVLGQSFPSKTPNGEKTFFLPPDEKSTPIFKPAWPRRTYDPQELTYNLRPFKVTYPACRGAQLRASQANPSNTLVSTTRSGRRKLETSDLQAPHQKTKPWKRRAVQRHKTSPGILL